MIFDTFEFFKNNRDIQIFVETTRDNWKLVRTISPHRVQKTVETTVWWIFHNSINYMHPVENYSDIKEKALKFCVVKDKRMKMVTKTINWIMDANQKSGHFEYGGDEIIWTSWEGWYKEYR